MWDASVPGSTAFAQHAAAPLRFASVKSTHKDLQNSHLTCIVGVRRKRVVKAIRNAFANLVWVQINAREALKCDVNCSPIYRSIRIQRWSDDADTLFTCVTSLLSCSSLLWKAWDEQLKTGVQASHLGDYQSSVAAQSIFDVTALERLLESKLQIFFGGKKYLPNDDFQCYSVATNINING